jgi:hypothetical protein
MMKLYVPDNVLEEARAASYQIYEWMKTSEWKTLGEKRWAKVKLTKEKPSLTGNNG